MDKPYATIAAIILLTVIGLIGVYDAVAIMSSGRLATASSVVIDWASRYPVIAVLVGMILGHLFFPSR